MHTIPNRWCLVRISDDVVKVLGTWSGGYLDGDSWKINSGIKSVESTDDAFLFTGLSGSVYECRKGSYGLTVYGASILNGVGLKPMKAEEALDFIKNFEDIA